MEFLKIFATKIKKIRKNISAMREQKSTPQGAFLEAPQEALSFT